jgi:D-beta-D-heptose 7-phosphate kinase / D-beta-D-heptose 1-phosphate adenosyltransferase
VTAAGGPLPPAALLPRLTGLEVVVLGDPVLDAWLDGSASRLCREGPVPVVEVAGTRVAPGGAANAAANLAALGARVRLVGPVGDDADAAALRGVLAEHGVDTSGLVAVPGRPTPAKRRLVADGQLVARFDATPGPLAPPAAAAVAVALAERLPGCARLLVSDYGLGAAAGPVRDAVVRARDRLELLVVDAHELAPWAPARPTAVTPNADETRRLLAGRPPAAPAAAGPAAALGPVAAGPAEAGAASGGPVGAGTAAGPAGAPGGAGPDRTGGRGAAAFAVANAAALLRASGAAIVAATADEEGAVLLRPDRPPHRVRVRPAPESRTTGAGDTLTAALTLALAAGLDPAGALEVACAAAGCVVRRPGTVVCDSADLARCLGDTRPAGVVDDAELAALVARYRRAGLRIVFTNGCFDLLHTGHLGYLEEARRLGDVLVVGLNSDASVRRLKGPDRPVTGEADRAVLLAALPAVDHVVVFGEDSPVRLIELVRPDVYVKGGDYTAAMLAETPVVERLGGTVRTVGYQAHSARRSSTRIIETIRSGGRPG